MGNSPSLGVHPNEAMKVLVQLESVMASVHISAAVGVLMECIIPIAELTKQERADQNIILTLIMITYIIWIAGLFIQTIFFFPLFRLGFLKRNVKICMIWMIMAGTNYVAGVFPPLIMNYVLDFVEWKAPNSKKSLPYFTFLPFYMIYLGVGIPIVNRYRKWVKESGIVGQSVVGTGPDDAGDPPPSGFTPATAPMASTPQQPNTQNEGGNASGV